MTIAAAISSSPSRVARAMSYTALERMIAPGLAGVAISASKVPVVCSSRSLREKEARPT